MRGTSARASSYPGDAAATASNILASEGLFRLGFVSDLVAFLADTAVSVLFYVLLSPVSRTISALAAAFRLLAHPAIASVNLLNHFGALLLLSGADYLRVFEVDELEALALLATEAHKYGYLIGGAFFGFHLALLGYLLFRSALFPRTLGILVAVASVGYLTESLTYFVLPAYESIASVLVVVTASVAELSLCGYLTIKGVRDSAPAAAAGTTGYSV